MICQSNRLDHRSALLILPCHWLVSFDFEAEEARLRKEIKATEAEIDKIARKLGNEGFIAKAPEAVVEENKRRLAEEQARADGLTKALSRLQSEG